MKISLKNTDKYFWVLFLLLVICSVISSFASSTSLANSAFAKGQNPYMPVISHTCFLLAGIACAFFVQFVPSKFIRAVGYALLAFSFLTLILCYVPGFKVSVNGANRWVKILGVTFQPSELAKLSLVIVVADLLSRGKNPREKRNFFLITLAITLVIVALIIPNNLSTAVLIVGVIGVLFILARVKWWYLLITAGSALAVLAVAGVLIYFVYIRPGVPQEEMPHVLRRVPTWVARFQGTRDKNEQGDEIVVTNENLQKVYAQVAVANGGTSPVGVLPGNSMMRNRLPLAYADYIYAIIVEETGIIGATFLILLYLCILFRACFASSKYSEYAALLMVMGLALMLTLQAFISMEVSVGLGPVTGQPLPLITRGGTSIVITSLYFGIMMSLSREQKEKGIQVMEVQRKSLNELPTIEE